MSSSVLKSVCLAGRLEASNHFTLISGRSWEGLGKLIRALHTLKILNSDGNAPNRSDPQN